MSDFLQFLKTESAIIDVGIVQEKISADVYSVHLHGKDVVLKAAINDELYPGSQVIVNRTKYRSYIVGVTQTKKVQKEMEVIING